MRSLLFFANLRPVTRAKTRAPNQLSKGYVLWLATRAPSTFAGSGRSLAYVDLTTQNMQTVLSQAWRFRVQKEITNGNRNANSRPYCQIFHPCCLNISTRFMLGMLRAIHTSGIRGLAGLFLRCSDVTTANPRRCASAITKGSACDCVGLG